MWLPTTQDVLLLHRKMTQATGGGCGVRDAGLIESAIARAHASFAGVEAHEGLVAKACAVGLGLTQNHALVDGNKRIGMAMLLLILRRNGVRLRYEQDELVQLGMAAAQGAVDTAQAVEWVEKHRDKNAA